jgi:hypothetical protein
LRDKYEAESNASPFLRDERRLTSGIDRYLEASMSERLVNANIVVSDSYFGDAGDEEELEGDDPKFEAIDISQKKKVRGKKRAKAKNLAKSLIPGFGKSSKKSSANDDLIP